MIFKNCFLNSPCISVKFLNNKGLTELNEKQLKSINKNVKFLYLNDNNFTNTKQIALILLNSNIQYLNLTFNKINNIDDLINVLPFCSKNLKEVILWGNNLSDDDEIRLAKLIPRCYCKIVFTIFPELKLSKIISFQYKLKRLSINMFILLQNKHFRNKIPKEIYIFVLGDIYF